MDPWRKKRWAIWRVSLCSYAIMESLLYPSAQLLFFFLGEWGTLKMKMGSFLLCRLDFPISFYLGRSPQVINTSCFCCCCCCCCCNKFLLLFLRESLQLLRQVKLWCVCVCVSEQSLFLFFSLLVCMRGGQIFKIAPLHLFFHRRKKAWNFHFRKKVWKVWHSTRTQVTGNWKSDIQ